LWARTPQGAALKEKIMPRRRWVFLWAIAALCLLSCKDSTAPPPTLSGQWFGSASTDTGVPFSITLTLHQAADVVTGSGNLTAIGFAEVLTARGTSAYPNVSLILTTVGYQPMNFTGRFANAAQVTGTLNGSGFVNAPIIFDRQ
jgi:hypothetical protein